MIDILKQNLGLLFQIFMTIINVVIFVTIKFNDMKHVSKDVNTIKEKIEKIFIRFGKLEKGLMVQKAICNERHKK